jgi:outer membrane immunogenic protein
MKRFLLATTAAVALAAPAQAADMPVKAPPIMPVTTVFSWTGLYIGAHAGGVWFNKDWTARDVTGPVPEGRHTASSWLAGGQVGFNYQVNQWVLGLEAQFSATRLDGSHVSPNVIFVVNHSRTDFIGTIAGRVGMAWDRTLLYVKGGGSWARDKFFNELVPPFVTPLAEARTANVTRWGWMVGVGGEYAFTGNWSVKLEYDYLDFGRRTHTFQPTPACTCTAFDYEIRQNIHLVKVGINYRFGGPVVARY